VTSVVSVGAPPAEIGIDSIPWESPVLPPLAVRLRARVRIGEITILTTVALVGYLWVAVWMRDDLHFFVNDALARTSDAVFVTAGRDPHLGAIGFYWPPLPQLIQCPFVPLLEPFGRADLAGPISSAFCIALTIPVLARLCTRLRLSRALRFGICALFALNPVVIYYAANGMSEACSILFIAVAMLGYLTFIQTRSTPDLIILTVGLCGAVLTRLEGPLFAAVMAVAAGVEWRRWRQSVWTSFLIALPPAACFVVWMIIQWVLLGSPTYFLSGGQSGQAGAIWLPNTRAHPLLAFPWAFHWTVILAPALALAVGMLIWNPISTNVRGTIGILAGAAVFPAIQVFQLLTDTGWGDPRYFATAVIFGPIAVAWLASTKPDILARSWNLSLLALLVVGSVTGPRALSSGRLTHIEGECKFFDYGAAKIVPFLGTSNPRSSVYYCGPPANYLAAWQKLDATIDRTLKPNDRVLADNFSNYYAVLYTKHPDQFVVRNDRDWLKITANPIGKVTYIVTVGQGNGRSLNELPGAGIDVGRTILKDYPGDWKLVAAYAGGADFAVGDAAPELFKYVGHPARPTS
jgi:hypothetical protein